MTAGFHDRKGHCYELAYRYVLATQGARLVHGFIGGPKAALNRTGSPQIGHAWAITPAGDVYDAILDQEFDAAVFAHCFAGEQFHTYSRDEAMINALDAGHFGPWSDDFDARDERHRAEHEAWLASPKGRRWSKHLNERSTP